MNSKMLKSLLEPEIRLLAKHGEITDLTLWLHGPTEEIVGHLDFAEGPVEVRTSPDIGPGQMRLEGFKPDPRIQPGRPNAIIYSGARRNEVV